MQMLLAQFCVAISLMKSEWGGGPWETGARDPWSWKTNMIFNSSLLIGQ